MKYIRLYSTCLLYTSIAGDRGRVIAAIAVVGCICGSDYTIVHGFEANYAAKLEKMGYVLALACLLYTSSR